MSQGKVTFKLVANLAAKLTAQAPVHLYRWTVKPWLGRECRYLPTCSEYALEAIEKNGAWKGWWQTVARLCRCHPFGSSGYDPVANLSGERHLFSPWRYGRWRGVQSPDAAEREPD